MFDFDSAPGESAPLSSYLTSLNDRQREAALATEGPLIVLAGAGSGKTKMLTSRIAYLIERCGVPAYQILAMTFTNKAAGEMRERVEKVLRSNGASLYATPEIGTFHSVCIRLLRREIARTPFNQSFVVYDDSDQLTLIKGIFSKLNIDEKSINPKSVQGAINRAKCDAIEPKDLDPSSHSFFEKQVKRIYELYQKDLFANHALDFGEIICLTYRLLRDHPDLREKYQLRFRYIHVDEYQDTNRAQYLLLSLLAGVNSGGHTNLCVVGDEDQSIYKWRGADIRNILDFERDFPGASVVKLEQNYRSTRTIVRAASQVIRNNSQRKEKSLWTDNEEGRQIIRFQVPDERTEAEACISEIKRLAATDGRSFGDFAIFYRTNAQSRQFEDVLRREKIPYQVVGGLRFYDRKEIKDILCYFKAILNPSDSVSFKRIINVPARGIGKSTLERVDEVYTAANSDSVNVPYWEILEKVASDPTLTSAGAAKKVGHFVKLMKRLMEERSHLLLSELYHLILDETTYVKELKEEGTDESFARIENLEELDTLLREFEEDALKASSVDVEGNPTMISRAELLPLFIEQSSLASDTDQINSYASSVKMMTLHSSKGLEFPVVFVAGMEEGLFPSIKAWEETPEEEIEEERRLCYVGMTRAREVLYLMNAQVRRLWGNMNYNDPSRFFAEIPQQLIEMRDFSQHSFVQRRDFGARVMSSHGQEQDQLVGRKIFHPEYGPGTILSVEGFDTDRKVLVEFQGRDRRKFLYRYVASYLV